MLGIVLFVSGLALVVPGFTWLVIIHRTTPLAGEEE